MPFAPIQSLDVASELLNQTGGNSREAFERSAVGRLYYASFLQARQLLRFQGVRAATVGTVAQALESIQGAETLGNGYRDSYCRAYPSDSDRHHLAHRLPQTRAFDTMSRFD